LSLSLPGWTTQADVAFSAGVEALRRANDRRYREPVGLIAPCLTIDSAPDGWLVCDGRYINPAANPEYQDLATLLTANGLGGEGGLVRLPDLRGRVILGAGGARGWTFPPASTGGAASFRLTTAHLPPHRHAVTPTRDSIGFEYAQLTGHHVPSHVWFVDGKAPTGEWLRSSHVEGTTRPSYTTSVEGRGEPVDYLPPYFAATCIIKY
jgi:microcystin-dependent protein